MLMIPTLDCFIVHIIYMYTINNFVVVKWQQGKGYGHDSRLAISCIVFGFSILLKQQNIQEIHHNTTTIFDRSGIKSDSILLKSFFLTTSTILPNFFFETKHVPIHTIIDQDKVPCHCMMPHQITPIASLESTKDQICRIYLCHYEKT